MADSIWHTTDEFPQGEGEFITCLVEYDSYILFHKRYGVRNFNKEEKKWYDEDGNEFSDYFTDVQKWAYIKDIKTLF